jgi:uncharacterized protein YlxW (UPF0749 family)
MTTHPHAAGRASGPLPDRVTLPLLELVTREAMDQDYQHAARRRAQRAAEARRTGEQAPVHRTGLRFSVVAVAAFGVLIAVAAVQTSRDADVSEAARSALVDRIDERKQVVDGSEKRIDDLRADNDRLRTTSGRLARTLGQATVDLRALQIGTGAVAVTGPGVRISVDDNPQLGSDGQVRSTDLRLLVNALWESGAEAVAINGRRLTALSAITSSAGAINVNQSPLSPPYVVTAIGDDKTLPADVLDTASGVQFEATAQQYGYRVDPQPVTDLVLPAAPPARLRPRYAKEDSGVPDKQPDNPNDQQQEATP